MNDRNDWDARDRWQDEGRSNRPRDNSGEFGRDRWSTSGTTGAQTPRSGTQSGRQDMRGDHRTHDWEVGDRHYSGPTALRSSNMDRGNASYSGADYFTSQDYGGGTRAWAGPGQTGMGAGSMPSYGGYSGQGRYGADDGRGFIDRAVDEVRTWFGDEDAERRREEDHRGRGPSDYIRSDERIREDANDRLTEDPRLDARQISVMVTEGEVTLTGTVGSRSDKRRAEDCVDAISGVKHVQNNLRVRAGSSLEGQGGTLGWGGGDSSVTPSA